MTADSFRRDCAGNGSGRSQCVRVATGIEQETGQGDPMRRTAIALLLLTVVSSGAFGQTRCRTDSFGNTVCRDSDGNTVRGRTDSFGNATWKTAKGF